MGDALFELGRRTFDTPHFRGIEFIEVECKTILNKVPGTYLPFNWTINPYRGCSHACTYCQAGDTPILMADGRTKQLAELAVGDQIVGTEVKGRYRRYVTTEVLDHWSTMRHAYRVSLTDGTELIASADHRYLSDRGWKYIQGTQQGPDQRPHLTTNNTLLGPGRLFESPKHTPEFMRGYLCGVIRGDGSIFEGVYQRKGGGGCAIRSFRLALVDGEALDRSARFLEEFGVTVRHHVFQRASETTKEMMAISTARMDHVRTIRELIEWPNASSQEWRAGFLSGIYDAEGGCSRGVLRISNSDIRTIDQIVRCMRGFGFQTVVELSASQKEKERPVSTVRLTGGLPERLRFWLTTDPAITRKRMFEGAAVKNSPTRKVVEIEDLGVEIPMYDITTGSGDFIANGVISHNCFARATHTFLDLDAGRDFETKIFVKVNAPEVLRRQLRRKSWMGETVAMGTGTDPYQRAEGRYKLMPGLLEALLEVRNPFSILTKGTLILRDIDLIAEAASVSEVTTAFSIGTLDEDVWRKSEPGTPHPRKRVEAVRRLNEAGIPCGVLVAPILPGISDSREQLLEVVTVCLDAGATHVSPILLHLRPKVREVYMEWLGNEFPELVDRYEEMYTGSYASKRHSEALSTQVRDIIRSHPRRSFRARRRPKVEPRYPRSEQLSLL